MTLLSIMGTSMNLGSSGDFFPEPLTVKSVNSNFDPIIHVFNDTSTRIGFSGSFRMPVYSGTPKIVAVWSSSVIAGNLKLDFDMSGVTGTASLDPSSIVDALSTIIAAPGTAFGRKITEFTLTPGNLTAGAEIFFNLMRDGVGADTMSGPGILYSLSLDYVAA